MGAKVKTIKKVMQTKIDDWCASIDNDDLVASIRRDTIVTGGSIVSMLHGERINDFDIYFRTKETTRKVAEYYVNQFNQANPTYHSPPRVEEVSVQNIKGETEEIIQIYVSSSGVVGEELDDGYDYNGDGDTEESIQEILQKDVEEEAKAPYRVVYMSLNAITLSDSVQLITRFHGEPDQIHKNFDFTHAKCWYEYKGNVLVTPVEALQCILAKSLHYSGSLYPIASLFRAKKFIERGWKCSAGELVKMAWQISELDLNDMVTLKAQLTGVDMQYLHSLVSAIETWKSNNGNDNISQQYVVEIIDRVFSH